MFVKPSTFLFTSSLSKVGWAQRLQVKHAHNKMSALNHFFIVSQRDQLRLGVDDIMDRFHPSVKHHSYQVDFVPVVRQRGSEK